MVNRDRLRSIRIGLKYLPPSIFINVITDLGSHQTKNQWPERLVNELRSFMLEHEFFVYSRTRDDSIQCLHQITEQLQRHFAAELWEQHPTRYHDLLKQKASTKINRIRTALIAQGVIVPHHGTYKITTEDEVPHDDSFAHVDTCIQSFNTAEKRHAIQSLLKDFDQDTVRIMLAQEVLQRQSSLSTSTFNSSPQP